jgi:hypothetical protein
MKNPHAQFQQMSGSSTGHGVFEFHNAENIVPLCSGFEYGGLNLGLD